MFQDESELEPGTVFAQTPKQGEQYQLDSDIDLLVEFKAPRFDWMAGLQIYLEEKLGRRIEIVRKGKHISHRFQKVIEKDILYV